MVGHVEESILSTIPYRLGMCRALLEASADVTQLDGNGLTALDLARRRKVDISKGAWHKRKGYEGINCGLMLCWTVVLKRCEYLMMIYDNEYLMEHEL